MNLLAGYTKQSFKTLIFMIFATIGSMWAQTTLAQDGPVVTLSTTVTGNQEQPKVLYIVPWQQAEDNTLLYQALNRHSADSIFGHIERSEHQREIEFLSDIE